VDTMLRPIFKLLAIYLRDSIDVTILNFEESKRRTV